MSIVRLASSWRVLIIILIIIVFILILPTMLLTFVVAAIMLVRIVGISVVVSSDQGISML